MDKRFLTRIVKSCAFVVLAGTTLASSAYAFGADTPLAITLTLKNHRFTPAAFTVPAGARVRITLINRDPSTEEFDSHDLRIERLVTPMSKTSFDIGPLRPGQYTFAGEFHASTAQGRITAVTAGR